MAPGKKDLNQSHEMLDLMPVNKASSSTVNVVCVIRDETTVNWKSNKIVQSLSDDTKTVNLYDVVAEKANYVKNSFILAFLKPSVDGQSDEEIILDDQCDTTLREVVGDNPGKTSNFLIKAKDGKDPIKRIQNPVDEKDDSPPETGLKSLFENETSFTGSYTNNLGKSSLYAKSESGFCGLVNQAMTCYLNSLLQTLFMTPEFRNALYRWKFQGTPEEAAKSIPFQLQTLFLKLQISKKRAVETTDLTKSFGWDSSEAWQQHDVQELCRVMFDALEETLKNTDQADIINQFYQGKMKDYVKCLKCHNESAREDTYLDIPLAIRPFGSKEAYSSIEEAFRAFTTPETLDGNNQYSCEKCNSKQDAHKGLKFLTFPYLLTIQLKRFSFDYNTGQRIKLHDRVTFPDVFKLNEFIHEEEEDDEKTCKLKHPEEKTVEDGSTIVNGSVHEECTNCCKNDIEANNVTESAEFYELFSILIHSGNALGGHYYAYIKSFADNQWYCFNDQTVSQISKKEIEKSFGGLDPNSRGYYSATYSSSTNAYMLMYRKKDRVRNAMFMEPKKWPEHIKKLSEQLEEDEEEEINKKAKDRNLCKVRLFCTHPTTGAWIETKLHVNQNKTLQEATEIAWKLLNLDKVIELDRCRLIKYDDYYQSFERSYEGEENVEFGKLLGGVKYSYAFDLLMETRQDGEEFRVYEQGGTTVRVHNVNLDRMEVENPQIVHVKADYTLTDLKRAIQEELGFPSSFMRVAAGKDHHDFKQLTESKKTLKMEGFYKSAKVFIEVSDGPDFKANFADSKFAKVLDKHSNTISLIVTLPLNDVKAKEAKGKEVTLKIDKRSTVAELKQQIEEHAKIPADDFRIYKLYPNDQEFEITNLTDQLLTYTDETKIIVRLGRALKPGETRVKIYFLRPNNDEVSKFLMEPVISNEMSIKELKKQVIAELKNSYKIDEPLQRIRLRKKSWKSPVTIYTDDSIFDRDIKVSYNLELFAEIVSEELQLPNKETLSVYVRRWRRSKHLIDPFEEILLSKGTIDEVKSKISKLSDIAEENVEIAKGKGYFPYESSVLEIEKELDWNPRIKRLSDYPLAIIDDGSVLYYRDKEEQLEELTEERRKELREKERKRLQKNNASSSYTRKEKALKIYTNSSKT